MDGSIFDADKQSYTVGGALTAQADLGDAIYRTLAAKQLVKAADEEGSLYAADVAAHNLRKYMKVK